MPSTRAAWLGRQRLLRLSNPAIFTANTGSGALDIPCVTKTGNILLFVVCCDVSSTVESPYTVTYDLGGSANLFTQHKTLTGAQSSEQVSKPRMIIATVKGVPITGLSKMIRLATFASTLNCFVILTADLPKWWSGTIGNSDASAGVSVAKNAHAATPITTGVKNSLVVVGGGCHGVSTSGSVILAAAPTGAPAAGGPYAIIASGVSGISAIDWAGIFGWKLQPASGASCECRIASANGANSSNWGAGIIEIRP